MNKNRRIALPEWLDGRTVAILSACIALGAMMQTSLMALRDDMGALEQRLDDDADAMEQRLRDDAVAMEKRLRDDAVAMEKRLSEAMEAMEKRLSQDIDHLRIVGIDGRAELRKDIGKLDGRLGEVEVGLSAIKAGMSGFDARLLAVEQQFTRGRHSK